MLLLYVPMLGNCVCRFRDNHEWVSACWRVACEGLETAFLYFVSNVFCCMGFVSLPGVQIHPGALVSTW